MNYDPRWDIANFIDKKFDNNFGKGTSARTRMLMNGSSARFLNNYNYCGQRLDCMSFEEASNIVMTKLMYGA
jgi:hypothetical protein